MMIWLRVIRVFSSMPLATSTISCPGFTIEERERLVLRVKEEGTAMITTSGSSRQALASPVTFIASGRMIPGQPERMREYYEKMGYLR